ncbi:MAG: hypothetical protein HOC20_14255 [Chloroflexi bacterium]|nr:hypothetical protein [Chloroflexota bacterium]
MTDCAIRQAKPQDDLQFSELAMFTRPELMLAIFGPNSQHSQQVDFRHNKCCFSFEHTCFIEEKERNAGSTRMVLDTETDNERGIQLYQHRGYRIESKLPALKTTGSDFELFKMSKDLN